MTNLPIFNYDLGNLKIYKPQINATSIKGQVGFSSAFREEKPNLSGIAVLKGSTLGFVQDTPGENRDLYAFGSWWLPQNEGNTVEIQNQVLVKTSWTDWTIQQPQLISALPEVYSPRSTSLQIPEHLTSELEQILNTYDPEDDEDSMLLRKRLTSWFEKYGQNGVKAVWRLSSTTLSSEEKMSELLIALGRANDYATISARLEVLNYFSLRESSTIRYGAIVGLSNLSNYRILPSLKKMVKKEKIPILKQMIKSTLGKYNETL
jgi:hypothetical protein